MLLSDLNQMSGIKTRYLPVKRNFFHDLLLKRLGIPKEVIPFMFSKLSYDMSSTLEDLPEIKESMYSSFKNSLFKK